MEMETPSNLPTVVRELLQTVEQQASRSVKWIEVSDLGGSMGAGWGDDGLAPTVYYRKFSFAGAAEELWHLRLDQIGYPRVYRAPGVTTSAADGATVLLNNLLQHKLIFPRLEAMGFDTDDGECRAIHRHVEQWLARVAAGEATDPEHQAVAYIAMVYICSRDYCAREVLADLDLSMDGIPEIAEARPIGDKLLPLLGELDMDSTESEYRLVLQRFVDGLELTDDDVVIMG